MFIRSELIHPLLVHLPIGLYPALLVFFLVNFFYKKQNIRLGFQILLAMTLVGLFMALKSGDLAEDVVNKVICDPTATKAHEEMGENVLIVTLIAFALEYLGFITHTTIKNYCEKLAKWREGIIGLCLLLGMGFLVKTGHMGASLTYEQAAAVHRPSETCSEFK